MPDDVNPLDNARQRSQAEAQYAFLSRGHVSTAKEQSQGEHTVAVQKNGIVVATDAPVMTPVHGDYYIPPQGAPVMTTPSYRDSYNVIAAYTPPVQTPTIKPGERIISHPLSNASIKFNADGSLDIQGDAPIRINGGGVGVITDIETQTDSDGHVTGLNLIRNNNVTLPE